MTRDFPPGNLRVSDAERDRALAELSEHFQAGRITQDEFDERSGLALTAKTGDDLRELFTDLPDGPTAPGGDVRANPTPGSGAPGSAAPSERPEWRPARGRRRPPIAAVVIACVIASIVIGNVATSFSQGAHQVNVGWVVPVVILLIVLRRIGRR